MAKNTAAVPEGRIIFNDIVPDQIIGEKIENAAAVIFRVVAGDHIVAYDGEAMGTANAAAVIFRRISRDHVAYDLR